MPCDDVRLEVGDHGHPDAGRCLMEHVSVLAGEPTRTWLAAIDDLVAALDAAPAAAGVDTLEPLPPDPYSPDPYSPAPTEPSPTPQELRA